MTCRHFGTCGGCDWQDVPYAVQLERKRLRLTQLLRAALGPSAPAVGPLLGQPAGADGMPWRFRHKAAFVFADAPGARRGRRGAEAVMGHYARSSKRVVPVEECPVHADRANRLAFALRDRLVRAGIPAAGPRLDGLLRHLIVRTSQDEREAVVMLVVTRNDRSLRAPIRAFLASADPPSGFLINVHDRPGPFMAGPTTIRVHGRSHVRETVLGHRFLVSPEAFFQTSPAGAALLLERVLARVDDGRGGAAPRDRPLSILDLYAGSGLFAVPLAGAGHSVTAVEENQWAVRDGMANARLNGLPGDRLRFVRARVEDALARRAARAVDVAILDPPRQGAPKRVIEGVFAQLAPPRALYVSCDPEALARELPSIIDAGYAVEHVEPIDMFPHTTHIETVVTLRR